jgi:superfamily II DNA or RNA helicase
MRDYQRECVEAVERAWEGGMRRPGVVLPTGAGKTVVFAHAIDRWRRANVGRRALVVAHRHELIEQAASKLRSVMPGTRVGVVKANRNETLYPVVVASIQTLIQQSRRRQLLDVGLIVVDEAHHAAAPTYVTTLEHFGALGTAQDGAKALGVTATMVRGDDKALGEIWQDVVYSRSIAEMIAEGWLVRPRGIRVRVQDLDLGGVRKYRGDYSETALGAALEDSLAPEAVAKAMAEHAMLPDGTVRPTLLFAPLVRTAELFRDALREAGFSAEVLSGKSTPDERERVLEAFKRRDVQIVCNAMLFTEGTDLPLVSCLVIARPTLNSGLYVQMVGRALRPDIGKDDALVLDVVGVAQRHRLAAPVDLFGTESADPLEADDEQFVDQDESDTDDEPTAQGGALSLEDFEPSWRNGPIVSEHIDLFHGSDSVWLRTSGAGVWFLAPGERYIAILPGQAGGYDVVTMHQTRRGDSKWVAQGVESLSYAMGWAEDSVTAAERRLTTREQSWRATTPTTEQRRLAKRLGIEIQRGMTAGELRSRCMVVAATFRIDPGIPAYLARGRS